MAKGRECGEILTSAPRSTLLSLSFDLGHPVEVTHTSSFVCVWVWVCVCVCGGGGGGNGVGWGSNIV